MLRANKCAGWTPQSFVSSRKNRAEVKQQSILNFLDEDEKAVCFILSIPRYQFAYDGFNRPLSDDLILFGGFEHCPPCSNFGLWRRGGG